MAFRKPVIVGNWKLNKTITEAVATVTELKNQLASIRDVEVGIAPVFTALHAVVKRLEGSSIGVSAQNCTWESRGAFTGEVAADLIADAGCRYCIVGHSERRHLFNDTDSHIARRARAAMDAGLTAIVCVGETESEHKLGQTNDRIATQITGTLTAVTNDDLDQLIIAYEPVWAIGTGLTATPGQAQEVHAYIRALLRERFGDRADTIRIQYGGSVKPGNAAQLLAEKDIDGALVGGASLKAEDFIAIVRAARPS